MKRRILSLSLTILGLATNSWAQSYSPQAKSADEAIVRARIQAFNRATAEYTALSKVDKDPTLEALIHQTDIELVSAIMTLDILKTKPPMETFESDYHQETLIISIQRELNKQEETEKLANAKPTRSSKNSREKLNTAPIDPRIVESKKLILNFLLEANAFLKTQAIVHEVREEAQRARALERQRQAEMKKSLSFPIESKTTEISTEGTH